MVGPTDIILSDSLQILLLDPSLDPTYTRAPS